MKFIIPKVQIKARQKLLLPNKEMVQLVVFVLRFWGNILDLKTWPITAIKRWINVSRPTRMIFNAHALLHNLNIVRRAAPYQKIMAMVKADAYGCGVANVAPVLEGHVDTFGVAFFEEAVAIR